MESLKVINVRLRAGDDDRTEHAARLLLTDLRGFDAVQTVERATDGQAPAGARSGELLAIGGLAVTLLGQPDAVAAVLKYVADRIGRRRGRVEMEIDGQVLKVENATAEQTDVLVEAFVRRVFEQRS